MDLSTMSREALVRALFATTAEADEPSNLSVRDGIAAPYPARAIRLERALDIARELLIRQLDRELHRRPVFDSPPALRDWLRLHLGNLEHEVFMVLFLDAQHRLIEAEPMFRGTVSQTSVYPREVVRAALRHNASAVALAHNHPSGETQPSRADEVITSALKSALALVDVRVIDHFVVAGDQWLSMAERWLL